MPEDRPTISSARLSAAEVSRHSFITVRRGFDPQEVRSFLEMVSRELSSWEQRDQDLRRELSAAEERASHPVLDESTLSSALGQQSAQVLRGAHEEAARIVDQAEQNAAALVREGQRQANDIQIRAESAAAERIAEAELAAGSVHHQVERRTEQALTATRAEGDALMAQAREQGRDMVEQAQQARKRVLADLAQRRRALHTQIEQFRAARDELAAAVLGVRNSVDVIVADLSAADDNARAAAARVRSVPGDTLLEGPGDTTAPPGPGAPEDGVTDRAGDEGAPAGAPAGPPGSTGAAAEDGMVGPPVEAPGTAEAPGTEAVREDTQSVESLFARIRASHESAPGGPPPSEEALDPAIRAAGVRLVPSGETVGATTDLGADPAPPHDGAGGEDEAAAPEGDRPLLEARAERLDPVTTALSRRLKRALQDDQNRLLDRLRGGKPKAALDEDVLPSEDVQRSAFIDASSGLLADAFAAGVGYAQDELPDGSVAAPDAQSVEAIAAEMASVLVTNIRGRLGAGGLSRAAGDEAADRIGAAYREWRGERIERLVGDYAVAAFSAGVLATAAGVVDVRWVAVGGDATCADCDDNSLAGAVAAGAEFPTGHRHPPAHAGCRCLVTPIPA